ncbi:hypothetical protein SAMN05444156_3006 [Verrucomicrobium sp. GAS474]|uniref:hypothetical protein n=1 Tax=Verrucomicrobium sp. GAS474 TaxID=1882831 RepID=UPI00087B3E11|nr:hypothetical protein [Verrucomicrobium sp. GAS474]SDU27586.1 hypothetical protein SAMN05444156_3006 [Verrucomicrobium sp. GAS474]
MLGRERGVALVVVLSFMALLVGVVLAFFSISQLQRQVSKSSSSQTSAEILADGAVNRIIGDLKSEIVAGSKTLSPSAGTAILYLPSKAANAIPALAVPGYTSATIVGSGLENVVKVSKSGLSFYSGGASRAIAASTTNAARNGHALSLSAWNKPLLMAKATSGSSTDFTPKNFTAPDWILVDRSGSNPTAWNSDLIRTSSAADTAAVVGRYAYVVYNEGGLLDANVAGYPSVVTNQPTTGYGIKNQVDLKSSLAYADLTQTGLNQKQIDQLAAWRNSGTLLSSGSGPSSFALTASSAVYTNFFVWANRNGSGFLNASPVGTAPAGTTDHVFVSRQQLLNFATQIAKVGGNSLSATQNALRYLGTFSRGVSQPSYIPPTSNPVLSTSAPTVALSAVSGGNTGYGLDKSINPIFPQVAASGTFTRNDGSTASVGDALVKKRFALDRLVWITYAGPIADDNGNLNPASDSGITTMIATLEETYGFAPTFLKQGGPANIKKYFGLEWKVDPADSQHKWFYDYHNTTGSPTAGSKRSIQLLKDIAALGSQARDPDFFELIKATVSAGSKAKVAANPTLAKARNGTSYQYDPLYVQSQLDGSLDYAILQIGANIIAQATLDAYPPRIVFDDSGSVSGDVATEFRGVKNLPYLYRFHYGMLKMRMESPDANKITSNGSTAVNYAVATSISGNTVSDTGVVALMMIPDVWNPHDVNTSPGYPSPADFRVTADSIYPSGIVETEPTNYIGSAAAGSDTVDVYSSYSSFTTIDTTQFKQSRGGATMSRAFNGNAGKATGFVIQSPNTTKGSNVTLNFTIPASGSTSAAATTMFREPTMLGQVNVSGSNLKMNIASDPDLLLLKNAAGQAVYDASAGGLRCETPDPLNQSAAPAINPNANFTGFVIGLYPVEWVADGNVYRSWAPLASANGLGGGLVPMTMRLQCSNPNINNGNADPAGSWLTYDMKFVSGSPYAMLQTLTPFGSGTAVGSLRNSGGTAVGNRNAATQGSLLPPIYTYGADCMWTGFVDPRSSRFSSPAGMYASGVNGVGNTRTDWIDTANGILLSTRPGVNAGYGVPYGSASASYGKMSRGGSINWFGSSTYFRSGLYAQNLPTALDDGKSTSGATSGGGGSASYYQDPDGVLRRAMGGYVVPSGGTPAATTVGLPIASTLANGAVNVTPAQNQSQSRPIVLNRPFASVAELGYVFSGTPWKNLDFFTPESGDAALLDIFCVHDTPDPAGLVAGMVDLNTRQAPVLQALFSGACIDENNHLATTPTGAIAAMSDPTLVKDLANAVISRSTSSASNKGPFQNVSELVGKYIPGYAGGFNGQAFDGFSNDIGAISGFTASPSLTNIQRFRESAIRPLASVGQTRVWNLMIDVVSQTGRYPTAAKSADDFIMEGERRYWVHLAIDRLTGKVLDKQVEVVQQ